MLEMNKTIYLDHAATTATRPEGCGSDASLFYRKVRKPFKHLRSRRPKQECDHPGKRNDCSFPRLRAGKYLFTAGGTESDNWALIATAEAYAAKGNLSLHQRSSIMPFCIHASILKKEALRSLMWMWMKTGSSSWIS